MIPKESIIARVQEIAKPILDSLGLELIDVAYSGGGRGRALLRVFIDKAGGITLEDCERVSEFLGRALDVEDPIPSSYTLEVSSPGLDRPLRRHEDYVRSVGKLVKIKTAEPIDHQWTVIGRLLSVDEAGVEVALDEARSLRIGFQQISAARLEVEF